MTHREEQLSFNEGAISFHFDIEEDLHYSKVINIVVYSNFNSGVPNYPLLENKGDGWKLYSYTTSIENGNPVTIYKSVENIYARKIVERILEIKEEETPRFVKG